MIINFDYTKKILYEQDSINVEDLAGEKIKNQLKITSNKESSSKSNKILKPQGIIFEDTYNNFLFPIRPQPQLDTSKIEINIIYQKYRELYSNFPSLYLPWHYVVEMIGDRYYIFNTRPIDTKYPMTNFEVVDYRNNDFSNDSNIIQNFFERQIYQIENMIHICIIGDTNLDVYPFKVYKQIGQMCIAPLFRQFKIFGGIEQLVFDFNIGRNFRTKTITRFAKK